MARYRGRGRRGYFNAGGPTQHSDGKDWEPKVDKNPFYRTMDIFNGVFKKNIKLSGGPSNCTDLHTIYVNFGELKPSRIRAVTGPGKDSEHAVYDLECGHSWEGKTTNKNGSPKVVGKDWGMCGVCGAEQIYRGFEHEWQHIIFKSDLAARKIFVDQYAEQLHRQAPQVDIDELKGFLHLLVNAFDDLRVNSLWEKVYPGSALAIWDRWRWLALSMGDAVNTSFLSYVFAVAFGLPTNPQGEFEAMRPVIEWAVQKVKYRGFANMLIDVRVVLDRCMGALLAGIRPPQPPKSMQPPPPPSLRPPLQPNHQSSAGAGAQQGSTESDQQGEPQDGTQDNQAATSTPQQDQGPSQDQSRQQAQSPSQGDSGQNQALTSSAQGSSDQEVEEEGESSGGQEAGAQADGRGQPPASRLGHIPSQKDVQATEDQRSDALKKLMAGAEELDDKEEHSNPTDEDLKQAQNSQSTRAMVAKALNQDLSDLSNIDSKMPTGEPDEDMKQQLDQLKNGVAQKSESSQLTGNAKARVSIIEVTRDGHASGSPIELSDEERFYVQRMRSAFFRTMGRQKAKRAPTGNVVDVQALIQYLGDHQDPNVFENEDVNQGFAYSTVCDMSGSMMSTFPVVCHAVEMLKEALDFPFVLGNLWGFRGGDQIHGMGGDGEVWMYRYAKDVNWYTGTTPHRVHQGFNGVVQVPVRCGGITPMNSAINVASTHLWRKMPNGMAKRMFLLTDGSPIQTKVTGAQLPEFMLRQFVAKEIRTARKHGIQVFTIVIGEHAIEDAQCLQMFGPRKYWRRVGQDKVGSVLANMVLANFSKYIRARG